MWLFIKGGVQKNYEKSGCLYWSAQNPNFLRGHLRKTTLNVIFTKTAKELKIVTSFAVW